MKKTNKLIIFLFMFLISITGVKAYDQTFNVNSSVMFGKGTNYEMGEMTTPNGNHAYCLDYGAAVPPTGTTYTFSEKINNKEIVYATHRDVSADTDAERQINVYINNKIIWNFLDPINSLEKDLDKVMYWQNEKGLNYSEDYVKRLLISKSSDATSAANYYTEKKSDDALELSTSKLDFTKSGDYFTATIKVDRFTDFYRSLSDFNCKINGTNNTTCNINGNIVEIKIPVSSITENTTNINVEVSALLSEKVAYKYTSGTYQSLSVPGVETKTLTKTATGTIKVSTIEITKKNNKDDIVSGAKLRLKDSKGNVIKEWTSSGSPEKIIVYNTGKYYLTETEKLNGYAQNDSSEVIYVNSLGETYKKEFINYYEGQFQPYINISKVDINTGKLLKGAKYNIYNSNNEIIEEWTSPSLFVDRVCLNPGNYYLKEVNPPAKYLKNKEKIYFTVGDTGKLYITDKNWGSQKEVDELVLKDEPIKLSISKQDATTKKELPGATLRILDLDGNILYEWVSTDTPYIIEGIEAGKYVLVEITSPDGYSKSEEKIEFEVKNDGTVNSVVMLNEHVVEVGDTAAKISFIIIICGIIFISIGTGVIYILKKRINAI